MRLMAKRGTTGSIIIWADASSADRDGHLAMLRDAVKHGSIRVVGVGSETAAIAADLAAAFKCDRIDDLRQAAQRDDAQLLWITAPMSLDQTTLKLIHDSPRMTAVNQPQPGVMGRLPDLADVLRTVHLVPLMRRSPGYRAAMDVVDDFGVVRCVNVSFRSGPGEPALYSRLYDAMDLIVSLCGQPEIVDAGLAAPGGEKPETLASMHGHMTVNLRFSDDRCACIAVSDRAGAWFRGVTLLGENGSLRISDTDFQWRAADGRAMDAHDEVKPLSAGALCGLHIQRLLERRDDTEPPADMPLLLSLCEAARLSSRTGEGEEPRKVMQMLSRT
jgi:predicted dehydrogenase